MTLSETIDNTLMSLFPSWGTARIERRKRHEIAMKAATRAEVRMERAWEAADSDRFRGEKWLTSKLSPTAAVEEDLETLWGRAEDLLRNDAYASSAINGRVDNVIGSGMTFHSRIKAFGDLISDREAQRLNESLEFLHGIWARHDRLKVKQRLYERSKATYGEGLGVISDVMSNAPVPLTWSVISPRRLETPPHQEFNPLVRLGIQFTDDTYTDIEGYWIRETDKNDTRLHSEAHAFYPEWRVTHSFEALLPGQIRGVPWLSPVMAELKDIKDFKEAKLILEQVSACTMAFIKTADPYGRAVGAAVETSSDGTRTEELYPARVEYIGEDEDVIFADPNRPGGTMAPFMESYLRGIASGLRFPYELLTKHFQNSFAGGRLALSDGKITFRCWQDAIRDDALVPLYHRFLDEAVLLGRVRIDRAAYRAFTDLYRRHTWTPPRWPYAVNPMQESSADEKDVDAYFSTLHAKLGERGTEFDETIDTRSREKIRILEADARVEERRKELATELGDPTFGVATPRVKAGATAIGEDDE